MLPGILDDKDLWSWFLFDRSTNNGGISGAVGIVLLDRCTKVYKSNLLLIFLCILDEAAKV